ncbi:MAG: DUF429 domain-containing protein [Rubripirellula sp.]
MLAVCSFDESVLKLDHFRLLNTPTKADFSGFEDWLCEDGPEWIAGVDFPLGQPAELISALDWPETWEGYVRAVEQMGKQGFEQTLRDFKASQPKGKKHLFRWVDKLTASQSPMTLDYTPVGKMFFQGAYRLRNANVSILPVRPLPAARRIVVETYPALVTRKWIGTKQGYKNDDVSKCDQAMETARCDIVSAIRGRNRNDTYRSFEQIYGFTVEMSEQDAQICLEDTTGDSLDSVLCAIQAAWAYTKREENYGIPDQVNLLEGWISDPETLQDGVRS